MTGPGDPNGLRAARLARGWSQTDAARELLALARGRGLPAAAPASLKTLLSRWENAHTAPDPQYRTLLAELYGHSMVELGLTGPDHAESGRADDAADTLAISLATAEATRRRGLTLWEEQLQLVHRLDEQLGTAGAGELTSTLVDRLAITLAHTVAHPSRVELSELLTDAATLAGTQCLDAGRPDQAWQRFDQARAASAFSGRAGTQVGALAGQAAVLIEIGQPDRAVELVTTAPAAPAGPAAALQHAATAMAMAATGARSASTRALGDAERQLDRSGVAHPADQPRVELSDLHRWRGRVLVTLQDPAAEEPLRHALQATPRAARHRAAVHADLALALQTRAPQESARHAATARRLAAGIGSTRIPARLDALGHSR